MEPQEQITTILDRPNGEVIFKMSGDDLAFTYGGPGGRFYLGIDEYDPPWRLRQLGSDGEWFTVAQQD